jgi:hypothetical protein
MTNLSKARSWEYRLKSGAWGFDDAEIGRLPLEFRQRLWSETMCAGKYLQEPSAALLAEAEALLAAA